MRLACVVLLCFIAAGCNRVDPASSAAAPAAKIAATAPQGPLELSAEQVAVAPILSDKCNLESIDGVVVVDSNPIEAKSRLVPVVGWLVDEVKSTLPATVSVRIQSTTGDGRIWQLPVVQSLERPDVKALFGGAPALLKSGFAGQMDMAGLDAGKYLLRLAYERDGELVVCDNGRAVVLK